MNPINKFKRRPLPCLSCHLMRLPTLQREVRADIHRPGLPAAKNISERLCHQKRVEASLISTVGRRGIQVYHLSKIATYQWNNERKDHPLWEQTIHLHSLKIRHVKKPCPSIRISQKLTQQLCSRWSVPKHRLNQLSKTCFIQNNKEEVRLATTTKSWTKMKSQSFSIEIREVVSTIKLRTYSKLRLAKLLELAYSKQRWRTSNKSHRRLSQLAAPNLARKAIMLLSDKMLTHSFISHRGSSNCMIIDSGWEVRIAALDSIIRETSKLFRGWIRLVAQSIESLKMFLNFTSHRENRLTPKKLQSTTKRWKQFSVNQLAKVLERTNLVPSAQRYLKYQRSSAKCSSADSKRKPVRRGYLN